MESSMTSGSGFLQTAAAALTLRDDVFRAGAEEPRPFTRGLVFIVIVGVVVAVASVVGTALELWTSPDLDTLQEAITSSVMTMPWWSLGSKTESRIADASPPRFS